jgi:hypothetical protein
MVQKSEIALPGTPVASFPPSSLKMSLTGRLPGMVQFQSVIRKCI